MKNFKLLSVLAVCLMALAFTSCNTGDDGYTPLTKEQQDAYQSNMSMGYYDNNVILWEHKNDADVKNQTDSVATSCTVSSRKDSIITVRNFPVAKLAEHITNADLKEAIAKESPRTLTCKYIVLPNSTSTTASIYACPEVVTLNLTYGADAKSHKVELVFTTGQGYCSWKDNNLAFMFYLYCIKVDDKQTSYITNSATNTNYVTFLVRKKQ